MIFREGEIECQILVRQVTRLIDGVIECVTVVHLGGEDCTTAFLRELHCERVPGKRSTTMRTIRFQPPSNAPALELFIEDRGYVSFGFGNDRTAVQALEIV